VAGPGQWVLAGTRWGGAGASLECWRGLWVERSVGLVEGASEVGGAGRPSSPTSMASSLSEEASHSPASEGEGGLGLRWGDGSSSAFPREGVVVIATVRAVGRGGGAAA